MDNHLQKMCFDQNHAPNANRNSKWVVNTNVIHKATQFQQETLEKILVTLNQARFSEAQYHTTYLLLS